MDFQVFQSPHQGTLSSFRSLAINPLSAAIACCTAPPVPHGGSPFQMPRHVHARDRPPDPRPIPDSAVPTPVRQSLRPADPLRHQRAQVAWAPGLSWPRAAPRTVAMKSAGQASQPASKSYLQQEHQLSGGWCQIGQKSPHMRQQGPCSCFPGS